MFSGIELLEENFPNKELEKLINNFLSNNNDENYKKLISEMEKSIFLMPLLSNKSNISGFVFIQIENKNYACIFSNMNEFNKWYKNYELNFMFYKIDEICKIINNKENNVIDGFIIDPYGLNMKFDKNIIEKRKKQE